jgi:hypothetical protein
MRKGEFAQYAALKNAAQDMRLIEAIAASPEPLTTAEVADKIGFKKSWTGTLLRALKNADVLIAERYCFKSDEGYNVSTYRWRINPNV